MNAHSMKVRISGDANQHWETTLGEFLADNADAFSERDVAAMTAAVEFGSIYTIGGGAAPCFHVCRVE